MCVSFGEECTNGCKQRAPAFHCYYVGVVENASVHSPGKTKTQVGIKNTNNWDCCVFCAIAVGTFAVLRAAADLMKSERIKKRHKEQQTDETTKKFANLSDIASY